MSKTSDSVQNANHALINIVENLSYINNVVKGAGICAAINSCALQTFKEHRITTNSSLVENPTR